MNTTLKTDYTVQEILKGFVYNELEGKGLFGLSGNLVIQPEYQRNYIYAEKKKEAGVIASLLKGYPLGVLYFEEIDENKFQVLDGQQRITSIGRFVTGKFSVLDGQGNEQTFTSLPIDKQSKIMNSKFLVYHCNGTESEIREWFQTINIAGVPLNDQEILNAVYSGPFVTLAKAEFSNSGNSNVQKWSNFISGSVLRQEFLATALSWVASSKEGGVKEYLSFHRHDKNIDELKTYFMVVIGWITTVFTDTKSEMRGLEWGRLYKAYHNNPYDPTIVKSKVQKLYEDFYVQNKRGIFEYILGGEQEKKLLAIRVFDDAMKKTVYERQTTEAKNNGISNCPECAGGNNANKNKIWKFEEMEADHVDAWSKGGASNNSNCQVLCINHNRVKGNK